MHGVAAGLQAAWRLLSPLHAPLRSLASSLTLLPPAVVALLGRAASFAFWDAAALPLVLGYALLANCRKLAALLRGLGGGPAVDASVAGSVDAAIADSRALFFSGVPWQALYDSGPVLGQVRLMMGGEKMGTRSCAPFSSTPATPSRRLSGRASSARCARARQERRRRPSRSRSSDSAPRRASQSASSP